MVSPLEFDEFPPDPTSVRLPRRQTSSSAQGMTVTLLADYSLRTRAWLPSAAIVALLVESGVTAAGARTAISRLARRGALESSRAGRHSFYRLTQPAAYILAAGGKIVTSFAVEAEAWDGHWTLIAFSLPQRGEAQRRILRSRLRYLGYAPLYDALWISPRPLQPEVTAAIAETDLGAATAFRAVEAEMDAVATREPLDAWDLSGVAEAYESFLRQWNGMLPRVHNGDVRGAEAVQARTSVMESYRHFVMIDPFLPTRTMPEGWLRAPAREMFEAVYDGLAEPALSHVLDVVARFAPGPQPDIGTHKVAELLAGVHPMSPSTGAWTAS